MKKRFYLVLAFFALFSAGTLFPQSLSRSYLSGTWTYYASNGDVITLKFNSDGTFLYGNNNSSLPKNFDLRGDGTYDKDFNRWWWAGKYEIVNNVVRLTPTSASGNEQSAKGKPVNWVATIVSNGEMVLQGATTARTYKKR